VHAVLAAELVKSGLQGDGGVRRRLVRAQRHDAHKIHVIVEELYVGTIAKLSPIEMKPNPVAHGVS
jgi:hypothetical protein